MARIRSLKPEFWDSPSTSSAPLPARLLFLAMWNWADDSGRGTAGLKELEAFAFPNDDVRNLPRIPAPGNSATMAGNSGDTSGEMRTMYRNFAEVCGDVAEAYGVRFYRVKNRPYYVIPSFKAHQAKDFRSKSKYPLETEGEYFDVTSGNTIQLPPLDSPENQTAGSSAPIAGSSAPIAGKKNTVTGEQGTRGTVEEGMRASAPNHDRGKTGTRLPANFAVTPTMHAWALENTPNIDVKTSTQKFRAHYRSVSGAAQFKTDWTACWEAWLLGDQQKFTDNQPKIPEPRKNDPRRPQGW